MFYMLLLFCTLPIWGAVQTVVLINPPLTKVPKLLALEEHYAAPFAENYNMIESNNKRISSTLKETDSIANTITKKDTIELGFQPSLLVWVL